MYYNLIITEKKPKIKAKLSTGISMDTFSKKERSEIMSKIHSRNTKIERLVFCGLRKKKIYFRAHYKPVIGNPDVALPKKKIAIFIDGDFWHGYKFSEFKKRLPKKYWLPKIEANVKRDSKNREALRKSGWKALRVWEHEIEKNPEKAIEKIINFLKS